MLKEYKYYSVNINLTDGKGKLFKVRVVINNRSAFYYDLLLTRAREGSGQDKTERMAERQP